MNMTHIYIMFQDMRHRTNSPGMPTVFEEDGNYDVKFFDQLLGEKKGLPLEVLRL